MKKNQEEKNKKGFNLNFNLPSKLLNKSNEIEEKLVELETIWNEIGKKHIEEEIKKIEREIDEQLVSSDEKVKDNVELFLEWWAEDYQRESKGYRINSHSQLSERTLQFKNRLIEKQRVDEKWLEELCKKKKEIIRLENSVSQERGMDEKIRLLRGILDANSEANKKITELEEKLKELEEEYQELEKENNLQREIEKIEKGTFLSSEEKNNKILSLRNEKVKIKEKKIIKKTVSFLRARNDFLFFLEEVIKELKDCSDKLKMESNIKHARIDATVKGISDVGESFDNLTEIVNPIKLVAGVISIINEHYKINFRINRSEEFKNYLENNERSTFSLNETYDFLIDVIRENEEMEISLQIIEALDLKCESKSGNIKAFKSFNIRYEKIYNIVNNQNERHWTSEDMVSKIKSLHDDLNILKLELEKEKILFEVIINKKEITSLIEIPLK